MIHINPKGYILDKLVVLKPFSRIEGGKMATVSGIIVHQTDSFNSDSVFASYQVRDIGAHFLIDKDGTIYQTASIYTKCSHVGRLKSRCFLKMACTKEDNAFYKKPVGAKKTHDREKVKNSPDRFPSNEDSIGIEIVGKAVKKDPKHPLPYANPRNIESEEFELVNYAQNCALRWLVAELQAALTIPMTEVFRHPEVSWKNLSEAYTAKWQKSNGPF